MTAAARVDLAARGAATPNPSVAPAQPPLAAATDADAAAAPEPDTATHGAPWQPPSEQHVPSGLFAALPPASDPDRWLR